MSAYEDDRILELLSRAVDRADPVPEHVTEAARESFTWRTIDAELAELGALTGPGRPPLVRVTRLATDVHTADTLDLLATALF